MKMMKMAKKKTDDQETQNEKVVRSKGFRKKLADRLDESHEKKTALVRARYIDRWNQLCGGQYNLDHPVVHLEWELCDLKNQQLLMKGKREEFFERAKLTEEEKEIYLHGKTIEGDPYTYIENLSLKKETGRAIKMLVKKKI